MNNEYNVLGCLGLQWQCEMVEVCLEYDIEVIVNNVAVYSYLRESAQSHFIVRTFSGHNFVTQKTINAN